MQVRQRKKWSGLPGLLGGLAWLASVSGCLHNDNRCYDSAHWLDEWCSGDSVMSCSEASEVSVSEPQVDKVCDPGMCVQWVERGFERSGCKASNDLCLAGVSEVCLGTVMAQCTPDRIPIKLGDCAYSKGTPPSFCAISKPEGNAVCAQESGSCDSGVKCINTGKGAAGGEGTVLCEDGVWNGFIPFQSTDGSACQVKELEQCEVGQGWCEGDEAWTCKECADKSRCTSFVRIDSCATGTCVEFEMKNDFGLSRRSAGCRVASDVCQPGLTAACLADTVVFCTPDGQTIKTYSCSTLQSFVDYWFGPNCVTRPGTTGVDCVTTGNGPDGGQPG